MRVLITGGTGSIGSAIVKAFSEIGQEVWFQHRRSSSDAATLSRDTGARAVRGDFNTRNWFLDLPKPDVLISCAGINIASVEAHEVDDDAWANTIHVNLTVPFQLSRWALPAMIERKFGRIIHIGSIYSVRGSPLNAPYNVSKHGLSGLTKSIAREYGKYGITCNEILPGPVQSLMMDRIAETKGARTSTSAKDYLSAIADAIPTGRLAFPSDIAAAALFLASVDSGQINGASLVLDGGATV